MSPRPDAGVPPSKSAGWPMYGMIQRRIMFQSSVSPIGMTGWKFMTNRESLSGPTGCSQLN